MNVFFPKQKKKRKFNIFTLFINKKKTFSLKKKEKEHFSSKSQFLNKIKKGKKMEKLIP